MKIFLCLQIVLAFTFIFGSTPLNVSVLFHNGYDSNVMRFSIDEMDNVLNNKNIMAGASTFDSHIGRIGTRLAKSIYLKTGKEINISSSFNFSNYTNNPNKRYWSGNITSTYKFGSYKKLKYSIRHLDRYYLRHYVDRDVSTKALSPCFFTDRDQLVTMSNPLPKRMWITLGFGFLQRYYDTPFTEFDLDVRYLRLKMNKRIKRFGTVSFQIDRGLAKNISYNKTAISSEFDRSYENLEWYVPIKMDKSLYFFNEIGLSIRQEIRVYEAESLDDPLHAGRNHRDFKFDFWIAKDIKEDIELRLSVRYRNRNTESNYSWVEGLKSFNQVQYFCKLRWDFSYDKY